MSAFPYQPPTQNLTVFNDAVFNTGTTLTKQQADTMYLQYPINGTFKCNTIDATTALSTVNLYQNLSTNTALNICSTSKVAQLNLNGYNTNLNGVNISVAGGSSFLWGTSGSPVGLEAYVNELSTMNGVCVIPQAVIITTVSRTLTIRETFQNVVISRYAIGANNTITIPSAVGHAYSFKLWCDNNTSGTILNSQGGSFVNAISGGAPSATVSFGSNHLVNFQSDGTNWFYFEG